MSLSFFSMKYVIFSISTFAFFRKFQLHYMHKLYRGILFIIVWYFWRYFILQMLYYFMRYFQCFSSPFPVFIIISICEHWHGSVKHWWHSSQSIDGCMLTSTKIWYLWSFCISYEIHVSVIWDVIWCSYRPYFYLRIMSVIFFVLSCDVFLCLQHILNWSCSICEHIWYVYVVWKDSYISMYMCIYTWPWKFLLSYIVSVWYFIFFDVSTFVCYVLLYGILIWYGIYIILIINLNMLFNFNFLFWKYNLYMSIYLNL